MSADNVPISTVAVVLYHANCCDGFGAAWVFEQAMVERYRKIYYKSIKYGENPFTLDIAFIDRDIYILDFSFPRETLVALAGYGSKVTVIDHHKTAAEDLLGWEDCPENLHIYFDMEYSGASLTSLILAPHTPAHTLIAYIEDRDLWRHKLEGSAEINAVIANTEKTFEAYTYLAKSLELSTKGVALQGQSLLTYYRRVCEEISRDARPCTIETEKGTYVGLVCNCTPQFASDVGNILATNSGTFGATYYTTGKGAVKWSIRSNGDYDISAIAKAYGGGGHKNAAGFTLEANKTTRPDSIAIWKIGGIGDPE